MEWDGGVWTIVDFQHVKPGKGRGVRAHQDKNVMTGAVIEHSFNPSDKMPRKKQGDGYLYKRDLYYFMDRRYRQIPSTRQGEDASSS